MFIKIIDTKEFAYNFYDEGVLKFSTSAFFNSLDDKEQGDTLEGRIITEQVMANVESNLSDEYKLSFGGKIDGYTYSIALIESINENTIDSLIKLGNQKEDAYAIIIFEPNEFLNRFSSSVDMTNFYFDRAKYVENIDDYFPSVFHLKKEKENQSEFRIFYNVQSNDIMFKVKIGSIKDIAQIIELSNLKDFIDNSKFESIKIDVKPFKDIDYRMNIINMIRIQKKDGSLIEKGTRFRLYKKK
jgi:hypothetical protein